MALSRPILRRCPHLGLASSRAESIAAPSSEHRCYLWMQRDQIDLLHQASFCLTAQHRHCPWLHVRPQGPPPPLARRVVSKIANNVSVGSAARMGASFSLAAMLCLGGWYAGGPDAVASLVPNRLLPFLSTLLASKNVAEDGVPSERSPLSLRTLFASKGVPRDSVPGDPVVVTEHAAPQVAGVVETLPIGTLPPVQLPASAPRTVTAWVPADRGGQVVAGNVALTFSPQALSGLSGGVNVEVVAHPDGVGVPGGPAQFSPNGTVVDVAVHDVAGKLITTFPEPVEIAFKYNGADLAMAHGDAGLLTAGYVLDADSPPLENPLGFPVGTWLFFPPSNTKLDAANGTVIINTQAIGSVLSVVASPVGYVQTLGPSTRLYSSFDPVKSEVFGSKPQFSYLRVMEPQIGVRLLVLDPANGNYAYVNAADVGPSGPPPAH